MMQEEEPGTRGTAQPQTPAQVLPASEGLGASPPSEPSSCATRRELPAFGCPYRHLAPSLVSPTSLALSDSGLDQVLYLPDIRLPGQKPENTVTKSLSRE